ncbi:ATP-binding cassette domain-containing protein, partial [candidate division KSB1 bacterium]|nr:ATP-binding cassette domain-containing protein [candidate division KSB1 bacterium]
KKRALKKLRKETSRRKQEAQQADAKRSKRGLAKKDYDARQRIDAARVTGRDGHAGKLQRQLQGRLDQMQSEFDDIKLQKEYTLGIWLPGSVSKRNYLLHLPGGDLPLGENKQLAFPALSITPQDRIAMSGPNGAGKSTLIRHILQHLNAEAEHITYVPQEIDLRNSRQILEQATSLTGDKLGHLMNIVSRLNSRPERLLQSSDPSPGEIRKLLLALGMTREPHIIIMDEPTNHLDLPSIECLENALANCPCALLLVSHDEYFLRKLTTIRWSLSALDDSTLFHLKIN